MKSAPLEKGILRVFRIFLLVQLGLILGNILAHSKLGLLEGCPWCAVAFGCSVILILLGYLSWSWLQEKMGPFYLPVALVLAAVFSLVLQNFFLDIRGLPASGTSEETAWQLFLFLFIPLVLVGWQYDIKAVIAYCLLTAVLDYTLMSCGRDDFYLIKDTYGRLVFIRALSFLIAGYIISHIMKQFRQQRAALQKANQQLTHFATTLEQLTISQERNRMARELHDTLAHTLSGIAVQLEAVQSLWEVDQEQAHEMLGKSLTATRSGLTETRLALRNLRSNPLEEVGLDLALRNLAGSVAERAGIMLDWKVPELLPELDPDLEQGLYRIAQEALENILRHAEASQVTVELTVEDEILNFRITDDGRGFVVAEQETGDPHYGLCGMQERAGMMDGMIEIESQPGMGTDVCLRVKI